MQKFFHFSKKKRFFLLFSAIVMAIILNGLLNRLSSSLSLPFFLDSIFTVMITAIFGLWPGLIVGLMSNLFFEVLNGYPGYLYPFAVVNMLTALITHLHVKYGRFQDPSGALWTIISLSLSNAILGALIVSVFFGGITNEPVDSIVRAVIATGQSVFSSAFLGRILINIVDKGIAVLITLPVYRFLYKGLRDSEMAPYKLGMREGS